MFYRYSNFWVLQENREQFWNRLITHYYQEHWQNEIYYKVLSTLFSKRNATSHAAFLLKECVYHHMKKLIYIMAISCNRVSLETWELHLRVGLRSISPIWLLDSYTLRKKLLNYGRVSTRHVLEIPNRIDGFYSMSTFHIVALDSYERKNPTLLYEENTKISVYVESPHNFNIFSESVFYIKIIKCCQILCHK